MFWDDLVRRWRREHRAVDQAELWAAGGHVAVPPTPRRRRRSRLPWLAIVVLAIIGGIALILAGCSPEAILAATVG